jgi:hypothetical protein
MGPFLSFIAQLCDELHHELAESGAQASRRVAADSKKMGVEVHSASHIALVEVWEHGHCLDITVMDRASGKSLALSAGPCATDAEALSRLQALSTLIRARA